MTLWSADTAMKLGKLAGRRHQAGGSNITRSDLTECRLSAIRFLFLRLATIIDVGTRSRSNFVIWLDEDVSSQLLASFT
jgi:hypothetical protein